MGLILSLCANGCVSTPVQNGGLVPVSAVQEIVHEEIQKFFNYLQANRYLLHEPLNGFPDGYWDIKELDPITLEPIPKPTLDPKGKLPDDIIQGFKNENSKEVVWPSP